MKISALNGNQSNLIYDVGMHKGEDSEFYLKKGFSVVGFEADPNLVKFCRTKFRSEIKSGRMILVEGAIVEGEGADQIPPQVKFFRNLSKSEWGTVRAEWANRPQNQRTISEVLSVSTVDFKSCLRRYGVPYYMKIDIEGADLHCMRVLLDFDVTPMCVSIESEKKSFIKLIEEIDLLRRLGYSRFQAVQQARVNRQREPFPAREGKYVGQKFVAGSSGLFGKDLPNEWISYQNIIEKYKKIFRLYQTVGDDALIRRFALGRYALGLATRLTGIELPGWYDTHAMR
jgi:FkbM family methyltransferase